MDFVHAQCKYRFATVIPGDSFLLTLTCGHIERMTSPLAEGFSAFAARDYSG